MDFFRLVFALMFLAWFIQLHDDLKGISKQLDQLIERRQLENVR